MLKLKVKRLENPIEKTIGLIGRKKAYPLMMETHFGIHTLGLRFSIDVLILDSQKRVAVLKESLSPYRIFFWNPLYRTVLELPEGTIKKHNIQKGTSIHLLDVD